MTSSKLALWILSTVLALALFGPVISPYLPTDIYLAYKNSPPSLKFWFGADELGRDLFVRVCWGARLSLLIAVAAALIDTIIGVLWASIAVHLGGKIETVLMKFCDILQGIPRLLLAVILTLIQGPGLLAILISLTLTGWIQTARIVRSHMLQIQQQEYVLAAKAFGATSFRIICYYLIPNSKKLIATTAMLSIPSVIFAEAFFSFLGLGIRAPMASLGVLVCEGLSSMSFYPWRLFFPEAFITGIVLAFHLLEGALKSE